MANTLAPFGFVPVRRQDGASWTANQSVRKILVSDTNKYYQGDVVKSQTSGYVIIAAASAGQIAGVFIGCEYQSSTTKQTVFSNQYPGGGALNDVTAFIIDDPNCVFLCQSAGTSGSPVGIAAVNYNADIVTTTAGSAYNGISGMALDDNSIANTATFPFRIVDVPGVQTSNPLNGGYINGYDTTTKYNNVLVTFNNQDFKSTTGI